MSFVLKFKKKKEKSSQDQSAKSSCGSLMRLSQVSGKILCKPEFEIFSCVGKSFAYVHYSFRQRSTKGSACFLVQKKTVIVKKASKFSSKDWADAQHRQGHMYK